jgi:hypothetical protein
LIDAGVILGEGTEDTVKTLRDVYQALTHELEKVVPEVWDLQATVNSLRDLKRAPGFANGSGVPK